MTEQSEQSGRPGVERNPKEIWERREPHRNWHVYSLGADLVGYGFCGLDADALAGLRGSPLDRLTGLLAELDPEAQAHLKVGDLLKLIVDKHQDELADLGRQLSWERRAQRYHSELAEWKAQPETVQAGRWRSRPMTSRQAALVQITANLLDLPIPLDLDRGAAADWLDSHGANLAYRGEK